jgi:hypothetical protein
MERLKLLDDLGFVWNAPRGAKRKRNTITIQIEGNFIQDHRRKIRNKENEERDSLEAAKSIELGSNEYSGSELIDDIHVEGNLQSRESKNVSESPDLNGINQGMS